MKRSPGVYQNSYIDRHGVRKKSAIWWIAYTDHGKKIRESSGSINHAVAVRLRKERLSRAWQGKPVGPDVTRTTLGDLMTMLTNDYKANGRKSKLDPLVHLCKFFGADCKAVNLTSDRIIAFVAHRQERGAANATINRSLALLKRAFKLAEIAGKVAQRPHVAMLTEDNRRTGFFEAAEFKAVVDHLPDYLKPVVQTAYVTGWRVASEILTRQKHHVDLENGWLRLDPGEGKTREGRMFPLTPELREVLAAQLERTRALELATGKIIPRLFHREGAPIGSFRKTWLTACRKSGVPGRIPHDFRRSAVRNLERAGVPRSAAMAMVGHRTQSIYSRYAIADESMLRDGAEKLAALHLTDSAKRGSQVVISFPKARES
jgi:integrase